jgi:hypothetical protein
MYLYHMPHFKELDPVLAAKTIEGYTNELAPEAKTLDAFYRQFRCQHCGGACQKETVPTHAFSDPDTLVPRSCLRCTVCKILFDPHSGLLLEGGEPAR